MSADPHDKVELYRARSLPEAHALRNLLEVEGIPAGVENELLQGALGDLPLGWATAPRVVVERGRESEARALLAEFLTRPSDGEETASHCLACQAEMGSGDVCPVCGWTYGPQAEEAAEHGAHAPTEPSDNQPDRSPESAPARADSVPVPPAQPSTQHSLWLEVMAVMAVAVIPNLISAVILLVSPARPLPYWLDSLYLIVLSGCTIFVTLYLIARSGDSWSHFGLTRPRWSDVPLGIGLLIALEFLWSIVGNLVPIIAVAVGPLFAMPGSSTDYVLMFVKHGANGFAEELVCRAYLITRFGTLLGSRGVAVAVSAAVFASYHIYQGSLGVAFALLMGILFGSTFLVIGRLWPLVIGHALCNVRLEWIA